MNGLIRPARLVSPDGWPKDPGPNACVPMCASTLARIQVKNSGMPIAQIAKTRLPVDDASSRPMLASSTAQAAPYSRPGPSCSVCSHTWLALCCWVAMPR